MKTAYQARNVEVKPLTGKVLKALSSGDGNIKSIVQAIVGDENLSLYDAIRAVFESVSKTYGQSSTHQKSYCACGQLLSAEFLLNKPAVMLQDVTLNVSGQTITARPLMLNDNLDTQDPLVLIEACCGSVDDLLAPDIQELGRVVEKLNLPMQDLTNQSVVCQKCSTANNITLDLSDRFFAR